MVIKAGMIDDVHVYSIIGSNVASVELTITKAGETVVGRYKNISVFKAKVLLNEFTPS